MIQGTKKQKSIRVVCRLHYIKLSKWITIFWSKSVSLCLTAVVKNAQLHPEYLPQKRWLMTINCDNLKWQNTEIHRVESFCVFCKSCKLCSVVTFDGSQCFVWQKWLFQHLKLSISLSTGVVPRANPVLPVSLYHSRKDTKSKPPNPMGVSRREA